MNEMHIWAICFLCINLLNINKPAISDYANARIIQIRLKMH